MIPFLNPSDIAKYASSNNCYVLTYNSTFFVYDTPGVISLKDALNFMDEIKECKAIEYYNYKKVLKFLWMTPLKMQCVAFMRSNDFVNSEVTPISAQRIPLSGHLHYVLGLCRNEEDNLESMQELVKREYHFQNSVLMMTASLRKYDTSHYPEAPMSLLTSTDDPNRFLEFGTNRGRSRRGA